MNAMVKAERDDSGEQQEARAKVTDAIVVLVAGVAMIIS